MLNTNLHQTKLFNILQAIYTDTLLRNLLGFKGGTCAMLFYHLPRFSVDLDFNLLAPEKKEVVFNRLKKILPQFGTLREAREKRFTLFFLLSYQAGEKQIKIDLSKRPIKAVYLPRNYLGISMLVMKEEYAAAGKLSAVLTRKKSASRDLFDLWFFLKSGWIINEKFLIEQTGLFLSDALKQAQNQVEKVKQAELLQGLGELLDNKQKAWVKKKLKDELLFQIKLYLSPLANPAKIS